MKAIFLLAVCLPATADSRQEPQISLTPIVAYSPTYGILLGGGFFRNTGSKPGLDLGTYLVASFRPNFKLNTSLYYYASPSLRYRFESNLSSFFTPYYGEGDQTNTTDFIIVPSVHMEVALGPEFSLSDSWTLWPYLDFRLRVENDEPKRFSDEFMGTPAISLRYHTEVPLGFGHRHELTLRLAPSELSGSPQDFVQAEIDLRLFWNQALFILASRLLGQVSWGEPSYSYRYSLGGNTLLRGYLDNRFRGKNLVAVQEEVRIPISKIITGVLFLDAGDVSDSTLRYLQWTYGLGLRMGIPPDYIAKARLDFGFGKDEKGIFFLFGDAF